MTNNLKAIKLMCVAFSLQYFTDRSEMANILVMDSAELHSVPTPISNYSKSRIILV